MTQKISNFVKHYLLSPQVNHKLSSLYLITMEVVLLWKLNTIFMHNNDRLMTR